MRNPCNTVPAVGLLAWILSSLVIFSVRAEVTVDGSLGGPGGPLGKVDNNYQITENLGQVRGGNLFHSFGRFSLNTGESATFTGPSPIQNILSRVTGGSTSRIDGTIRSTYPGASLYLINPAGIVFGPNAGLDVQGSFHATTADYIKLGDGVRFNAVPVAGNVLSSAPPEAFGFLEGNYAPISVQESTLEVPAGHALSLIGGDIDLDRSNPDEADPLVAPAGRVNIASVASPGEVVPRSDDLQMDGFGELGTVSLQTPDAEGPFVAINTAGDPGGSVYIRSGRFVMQDAGITSATQGVRDHPGTGVDVKVTGEMRLDRSEIASSSFGDGQAGNLKIAAGSLELAGDASAVSDANPSGIYTDIGSRAFGAGDAGDLDIAADELVIRNNAFINNNTLGAGRGGDIRLTSDSLQVLGEDGVAYVSTFSANGATGDGGNLEVTADNIRLQRRIGYTGLTTQVNSSGLGNAGDIHIDTGRLDVLDGAEISTAVFNGPGNAGDLVITADSILVNGTDLNEINASVSSSVFWNQSGSTVGDGGDIRITAHDLQVSDKGSITTRNLSNGYGDGGTIDIDTGTLAISGGGFLSSSRLNLGTGRAGDININAENVQLAGPSPENWPTGIFTLASVAAAGAGAVNIAADTVQVLDGAQINTRTFGLGAGGTVTLSANEVLVKGRDPQTGEGARIDARTLSFQGFEAYATGPGGDVQIHAHDLVLRDAGEITTASSSAGQGGDILLDVAGVLLEDGASISARSTNTGNAGSIRIDADDSVRLLADSSITTTADISDGGRIDINTRDLLYVLQSAISSSVTNGSGNGGDIRITASDLQVSDTGSITTRNLSNGSGDAGAIDIDTGSLAISGGGFLSSARLNFGTGAAGDININAENVQLAGPSPENRPTGIFTLAGVAAAGAGAVNIAADTVQVLDGAQINTRTNGPGAGGTVTLSANEVRVQGRDPQTGEGARIDARALSLQGFEAYATGRGGDVQIHAHDLVLRDAGEITTASSSAGQGGDILLDVAGVLLEDGASISARSTNTGNAGSIRITADDSVKVLGDSSITTAADISGGGRIDISARDLLYLLQSGITSSVADGSGNGGDITIDPEFVVLNKSRILANAASGDGGNITIISDHFISSADSLVDASSRLGIDGDIIIQSPDEELSNELAELPSTYLDAAGLLRERCSARRFTGRSSFVVGGRRGLPAPPDAGYSLSALGPGSGPGGFMSQREPADARPGPGVLLSSQTGSPGDMPDPWYSDCSW